MMPPNMFARPEFDSYEELPPPQVYMLVKNLKRGPLQVLGLSTQNEAFPTTLLLRSYSKGCHALGLPSRLRNSFRSRYGTCRSRSIWLIV